MRFRLADRLQRQVTAGDCLLHLARIETFLKRCGAPVPPAIDEIRAIARCHRQHAPMKRISKRAAAAEFLTQALADGPRSAESLVRQSAIEGSSFSRATLLAARERVNVETFIHPADEQLWFRITDRPMPQRKAGRR